ncbi:MAG: MarR family winged helix-turn-helix transcriptional regulator [Burkholderiales bacterium]
MRSRHDADAPIPAACACGRLRRASRALTRYYDDAMAASGLRVTQYSLLRTLDRAGTVRMSTLATAHLIDRTALARTLDPLVDAGYVRIARGRDARTREIEITAGGRAALAAAAGPWRRAQAEVAARLGRERFDTLIALLARLETFDPVSPTPATEETT